jgi:hypothetical protein
MEHKHFLSYWIEYFYDFKIVVSVSMYVPFMKYRDAWMIEAALIITIWPLVFLETTITQIIIKVQLNVSL